MRKALALAIVAAFALTYLAVPAQAAHSDKTGALHAELDIVWTDPPAAWWGSITGDVNGMAIFPPDPERENWLSGPHSDHAAAYFVVHYHEVFTICFGEVARPDGCQQPTSYITGHEEGVYVITPYQDNHFQSRGWVTGASPDYAYMIGWKYLENGWVIAADPTDPNFGHGLADVVLAPAH